MKNGKEIIEKFNDQPHGVIEGFVTLEEMINTALYNMEHETAKRCRELVEEAIELDTDASLTIALRFDV